MLQIEPSVHGVQTQMGVVVSTLFLTFSHFWVSRRREASVSATAGAGRTQEKGSCRAYLPGLPSAPRVCWRQSQCGSHMECSPLNEYQLSELRNQELHLWRVLILEIVVLFVPIFQCKCRSCDPSSPQRRARRGFSLSPWKGNGCFFAFKVTCD